MDITFIIHAAEEGGYWAESVGHGIFTQGDDLDELRLMIDDATQLYFEGQPGIEPNILWRFAADSVAA